MTVRVDGGETIASRQRCDLHAMGVQEAIWHRDQAAIWFACLCSNYRFEFRNVMNRCGDGLQREGHSGGFEGLHVNFIKWRRYRVEQESDPGDARRDLLEQL